MLKRAFLGLLEAFWHQIIWIAKTITQKLKWLRIKIFANFRHQLFAKPNFSGSL
jgi:hypothetical protein